MPIGSIGLPDCLPIMHLLIGNDAEILRLSQYLD